MVQAQIITPVAAFLAPSPRDAVYRLTERGAAWLSFHGGRPASRILHSEPKPISLPHRLHLARIVLAFQDAAKDTAVPPPARWILDHDRIPEASCNLPIPRQYILAEDFLCLPQSPDRPVEHYAPPVYAESSALAKARPDASCVLSLPGEPSARAFYIEADNGTETHTQLFRKLPGYHALLTSGVYRYHWPERAHAPIVARVLFIFTSASRLEHVLDDLRRNPVVLWHRPPTYRPTEDDRTRALAFLDQYCRFTTLDDLRAPSMFERPIWRTLTGPSKAIVTPRPTV